MLGHWICLLCLLISPTRLFAEAFEVNPWNLEEKLTIPFAVVLEDSYQDGSQAIKLYQLPGSHRLQVTVLRTPVTDLSHFLQMSEAAQQICRKLDFVDLTTELLLEVCQFDFIERQDRVTLYRSIIKSEYTYLFALSKPIDDMQRYLPKLKELTQHLVNTLSQLVLT